MAEPTVINARFKQKRGIEASIPNLLEGELFVSTDNRKLFVGTSDGNVCLCDSAINTLLETLQNTVNNNTNKINKNTSDIALINEQIENGMTVTDSGWIDCELVGNVQLTNENNRKLRYRKVGNIVVVNGRVKNITDTATRITILPEGFRPLYPIVTTLALTSKNLLWNYQLSETGEILFFNYTNTSTGLTSEQSHDIYFIFIAEEV